MHFFIIVPLGRPTMVSNVVANIRQQLFRDFEAIIVENGAGVGAWKNAASATVLRSSADHQSDAKNAALDYLESRKAVGAAVVFDDDDWYGPEYFNEIHHTMQRGTSYTARSSFAVRLLSGELAWAHRPRPHGPTLAYRLQWPMPRYERVTEDEAFFNDDLRERGWEPALIESCSFVYQRTPTSAFACSDQDLRRRLNAIQPTESQLMGLRDAGYRMQAAS